MVRGALVVMLVSACATPQPRVVAPAPASAELPRDPPAPAEPPDTDGDGVPDDGDRCVTEPETRNGHEDEDGCPDVLPTPQAKFTGTIKGIYFEAGEATIKPKSRAVLDRAVTVLNEYPEVRIEVSGHTDDRERAPEELGLRRAQAVQTYLVEHGVDVERVQVRSAGAAEPVDDNGSAAGRTKNRRIELSALPE